MTRLRVIKDGTRFFLDVPGAPSEKLPLWAPELFDGATVRLGKHAKEPEDCVFVSSTDWLQWEKEARERKESE